MTKIKYHFSMIAELLWQRCCWYHPATAAFLQRLQYHLHISQTKLRIKQTNNHPEYGRENKVDLSRIKLPTECLRFSTSYIISSRDCCQPRWDCAARSKAITSSQDFSKASACMHAASSWSSSSITGPRHEVVKKRQCYLAISLGATL